MPEVRKFQHRAQTSDNRWIAFAGVLIWFFMPFRALIWAGVAAGAALDGRPAPLMSTVDLTHTLGLIAHPGRPGEPWGIGVNPVLFWVIVIVPHLAVGVAGARAWKWWIDRRETRDPAGKATRAELDALSADALIARGRIIRPGLDQPSAAQLGMRVGIDTITRREIWISAEDTMLILAAPRTGKTMGFAVPRVLDHDGPVIATGTRPDLVNITAGWRHDTGHVHICDPQRLVDPNGTFRWAPARGCEKQAVAIQRARSLCESTTYGAVENGDFWSSMTTAVVRCYLTASAIDDLPISVVLKWVTNPDSLVPVEILRSAGLDLWADELAEQIGADIRQRGSVWAGVRRAFDALADSDIREMFDCRPSEGFQPAEFLNGTNTLYLVGTASAQGSIAPMVAALIEDVTERARERAAATRGGRCEPPLAVVLDEAANIAPLPTLPTLLSDGGGSGISTMVIWQSMGQARGRWGDDAAAAMWEASTWKAILGGGGSARDLDELSQLAGEIDEEVHTRGYNPARGDSWMLGDPSVTLRKVRVWPVEKLRTLPKGHALLLAGANRPIETRWRGWWDHPNAATIKQKAHQHGHTI